MVGQPVQELLFGHRQDVVGDVGAAVFDGVLHSLAELVGVGYAVPDDACFAGLVWTEWLRLLEDGETEYSRYPSVVGLPAGECAGSDWVGEHRHQSGGVLGTPAAEVLLCLLVFPVGNALFALVAGNRDDCAVVPWVCGLCVAPA